MSSVSNAAQSKRARPSAGLFAGIYFVAAALWIWGSDWLVARSVQNVQVAEQISTVKGWLFVAVTALIIYRLLSRLATTTPDDRRYVQAVAGWWGSVARKGVLLSIAVVIAIAAALIYARHLNIEQRESTRISTISTARANEIGTWMHHRLSEAEFVRSSRLMSDLYFRWQDRGDAQSLNRLLERAGEFGKANEYVEALVFDESGRTLARNSGQAIRGAGQETRAAVQRATETGQTQHTGIYYREGASPPWRLDIAVPLAPAGTRPAGVVVLRLDTENFLFPLLHSWPGDAKSGESLLVEPHGDHIRHLGVPRFGKSGASMLKNDSRLVMKASREPNAPAMVALDYRDVAVFGTVRPIPDTNWLLISKMDYAEIVDATIAEAIWIGLGALLVSIAIVVLASYRRTYDALQLSIEERNAQAARLRALQLLDAIANSSSDCIYAKDREGRYLLFNRESARVVGKSSQVVIGNDDYAVFPRAQADQIRARESRLMAEGATITLEEQVATADGERIFMSTKGPLRDEQGRIIGTYGISRDATEQLRAAQALRESEEKLQLFIEHAPAAIAMFDREMRYIASSKRWKIDHRIGDIDIVGKSHYDVVPDIPERWKEIHRRCLAGAVESCAADAIPQADGTVDWLAWEARPWRNAAGEIGGIIIAFEIITARKLAEERSAYFTQLVAHANDAIIGRDRNRVIVSWNHAAERMFGYTAEEIVGRSYSLLVPPDQEELSRATRNRVEAGETVTDVDMVRLTKDGRRIPVAISAATLYDAEHRPIGAAIVCRDNTERLRAQNLHLMQARLMLMIATGAPLIETLNAIATQVEMLADDVLCSILLADAEGSHLRNGASPSLPIDYTCAIDGIPIGPNIGSCGTAAFERREVITPDIFEDPAWHEFAPLAMSARLRACWSSPLIDSTGKVAGTLALYRRTTGEPTAWHRELISVATYLASICVSNDGARRALEQSEARYRSIINSLTEGVIVYDPSLKPLACNPAAERILRTTLPEMIKRWEASGTLPPMVDAGGRPIPADKRMVVRTFRNGESHRDVVRGKLQPDGSVVWMSFNVEPLRDPASGEIKAVIASFMDITERFSHEQEMDKLLSAVQQSLNSVMITDAQVRIEFVNDAFTRMTGYRREELIGKNPRMLASGKTARAVYDAMWTSLQSGEAWRGEFINRRKNGEEYTESVHITPIRGRDNTVANYIAVREDVSERKRIGEELDRYRNKLEELVETRTHALAQANTALNAEVLQRADAEAESRRLNEVLRVRQQALERAMKNLESFSYSVSHDLRAPLRAVTGYAALLTEGEASRLSDDGRRMLDRIGASAKKMDQLIVDILQYSRAERLVRRDTQVDMAGIAQAAGREMSELYPNTRFTVGPLPAIQGDDAMVRQIMANLIGNAFKFSARVAEPQVEVGAVTDHGVVEFFVRDNGAGFDMKYADKLFQMFKRMHSEQDFAGTGVGLAIVKRLVEHHHGRISADSTPGVQTTFRFTLAPETSAAAPAAVA